MLYVMACGAQPPFKKKPGLDVVGWFLGSQKSTRAFLDPPRRETPKTVIKKSIKNRFLSIFLQKLHRTAYIGLGTYYAMGHEYVGSYIYRRCDDADTSYIYTASTGWHP
jgi:hypothetical protein